MFEIATYGVLAILAFCIIVPILGAMWGPRRLSASRRSVTRDPAHL
jgi:hypothetical protein